MITQNLFHQGQHCRDISLNLKYLLLLKNVRDKYHFSYLARQVHPKVPKKLYKAYVYVTTRPHGYLLIDWAQEPDDRLRFRTCISPDEYPPIFYVDVSDETDKIELSRPTPFKNSTTKIR